MATAKQLLRREVLARLKAAAAADPAQLRSAALRMKLAGYLRQARICVALYAPLPHEVNLLPLLQEYPGHCYVFPRCLPGHQLEFCQIRDFSADTVPGTMNIPEPAPHTPVVPPEEIDLLIVPGVAFTPQGDRLGYGGGYYDRFIPRCRPNTRILSLAFSEQLVDRIPSEPHDLRIAHIITPG